MKNSDWQILICSCDLTFAIHKKDYDKDHDYNCPMCRRTSIITPEDLNPARTFRPHDPAGKQYGRQNNKREK